MISTSRIARQTQGALLSQRLRARATRYLLHWQAVRRQWLERLWWPFEIGTELPALYAHTHHPALPSYFPNHTAGELSILLDRVAQSVRRQRLLILATRTIWLVLGVTLALLLLRFVIAVPWATIIGAVVLVIALGVIYHRTHPVTPWTAARLLDRHLRLNEQLATALELAITPAPLRLAPRQMLTSLATIQTLATNRQFRPRLPWVELHVALALALLVGGLSLYAGPDERLVAPVAPTSDTPTQLDPFELGMMDPSQLSVTNETGGYNPGLDYTGAADSNLSSADAEALRQAAELSSRSTQELQELADALKDASVTSQAAQEIQAGNFEAAAQQISDLAKNVENLSPEARHDLAERLQQAAQDIQALDPAMAQRLSQAAQGLDGRSDRAASQGLEDLSKAIADMGQNVIPQSELAQALQQAGELGPTMNSDAPTDGSNGQPGDGSQSTLGEGESGAYGFEAMESVPGLGAAQAGVAAESAMSGPGAGQGSGSDNEANSPRINPNSDRVVVPSEQGAGPTLPRLGQSPSGAPDVVTTGPGATGPGSVSQGSGPITTGLDPNHIPRGHRALVEDYFRVDARPTVPQPSQPAR